MCGFACVVLCCTCTSSFHTHTHTHQHPHTGVVRKLCFGIGPTNPSATWIHTHTHINDQDPHRHTLLQLELWGVRQSAVLDDVEFEVGPSKPCVPNMSSPSQSAIQYISKHRVVQFKCIFGAIAPTVHLVWVAGSVTQRSSTSRNTE
eukprot:15477345-Alexandrium_andersonii.AAC.1